ncbi:MAG: hypothetical protein M3M98_01660, partial [Nitrospirota bacterium]|nr:hypothetical protein [Nitrospirota bacterium]
MKQSNGLIMGMLGLVLCAISTVAAGAAPPMQAQVPVKPTTSAERHLTNIRQLTFGRQNAEAYFSFSGSKLIFQSTNNWMKDTYAAAMKPGDQPLGCYQMYVMDLGSDTIRMVSTGVGTTTCGYFFPGDRRVLYSSTHLRAPNCPPKPKRDGAYRWALDDYDVFSVRIDGQDPQRLTNTPGYDAEATVSPDGKTIVFVTERYSTDLEQLRPGALRLARLDLATKVVQPIQAFLDGKHLSPQISADGKTVTFIADPDGVS